MRAPPTRRALGAVMLLSLSQIRASCQYSPPPVPSQGQGADTLGPGGVAVSGELGFGAVGSWWDAKNLGDEEVNTGTVEALRMRAGIGENLDLGLVGGIGPQRTFVLGPEAKWRFARVAPSGAEGAPGFHAAWISGIGFGASDYRYTHDETNLPRHMFVAPYTGILASGGIELVQMYTGLRVAASQTLGSDAANLTLYPLLAFGVQVRPTRLFGMYAEGDLAAGITTYNTQDTAVLGYLSGGVCITLDKVWGGAPLPTQGGR